MTDCVLQGAGKGRVHANSSQVRFDRRVPGPVSCGRCAMAAAGSGACRTRRLIPSLRMRTQLARMELERSPMNLEIFAERMGAAPGAEPAYGIVINARGGF